MSRDCAMHSSLGNNSKTPSLKKKKRSHTSGKLTFEKCWKLRWDISSQLKWAYIKKTGNNKCWQECEEKWSLIYCWWECKLGQPLWRTVWRFLRILNIELPYDTAIPLLGTYPKERKSVYQRDICTPMFVAALATQQPRFGSNLSVNQQKNQ